MTVTDLLTQAGIQYEQKENDNVYIECQKCLKNHLSVSTHTGAYHCWTAGCTNKGYLPTMLGLSENSFTPTQPVKRDTALSDVDREAILFSNTNKTDVIEWATSRFIDPTFALKIGVGYDKNSRAMVFPFRDEKGNLVGAKYRSDHGDMWVKGKEPDLYLLEPADLTKEKIVIVEGEIDAITLKQFGIPVVATLGAGKDKGLHLLKRNRQIYLGYDMDGAGEAGVEKAIVSLGRFRCKRVQWTAKDPNDMLKAGATKSDIITALQTATSLATDLKSVSGTDMMKEFMEYQDKPNDRLSYGYPRLDSFTKGLIPGVIGVLAEAGTGKSTFAYNVAANNVIAGVNVGVCGLEEHNVHEAMPKLAAILIGRNPGGGKFDPQEIDLIKDDLKKIQFYEGEATLDDFIDWAKECFFVHGVRLIVTDYLQLLVADEKNTEQLKKDCYKIKKLTKDCYGLTIIEIIQPKQKNKMFYQGQRVENNELDGSDARGGATINQAVDAMLTVVAVKGHPNLTQFEYTKVRGGLRVSKKDWLKQFTQLEYDHSSLRQLEVKQLVYGG